MYNSEYRFKLNIIEDYVEKQEGDRSKVKRIRQILFIAVFFLVGCSFLTPAENVQAATNKVTKISITNVINSKRTMVKGSRLTLKASVAPSNATYKQLKWTSSKPSVAYVNQSGTVTAKKNGTAVITATARDGSKKKVSVTITVGTIVSKVSVKTASNKQLFIGKTLQLSTNVYPSKASNKALVYSSSNNKVATVSKSGVIKAVGVPAGKSSGTAYITVKAADGSGKYTKYKVTVLQPVTQIKANTTKIVATPGKTVEASFSASPTTAYKKTLTYKSSNTKVATVNTKGVIKTVALGSAKITAMTTDGTDVKKDIIVNVVDTSTTIAVPTTIQKLVVGENYKMEAVVSPAQVASLGVIYTSSDETVLKVTAEGVVTAQKAGTAIIYVKAQDAVGTTAAVTFEVKNYADIKYTPNQFVAHMGSIYVAPSNSLPSYKVAGESGKFMGIECDVRETKDGEFVLIHDADISARTKGKGSVSSLTLAEIQAATMNKGTNISMYPGLTIPTLKDYLYVCKVYGMRPVLHIKSLTNTGFQKVVDLLNEIGLKDQAIITGGLTYMKKFKEIDPTLNIYWLCYLTDSNIDTAISLGFNLNVDHTQYVTQSRIEKAHANGLIVGAYTVNNMNTAKKLFNKGIDFVTTDMYDAIEF